MRNFTYQNETLFCEEVPVSSIADDIGTPFYVYSRRRLESNIQSVKAPLTGIDHLICYALKANANLNLLKILAQKGCGADVVSGGELQLALKAGFPPEKIVFAGVGKTDEEIEQAIRQGILSINIESYVELDVVNRIARRLGKQAGVAIRVNPEIAISSHPYIQTGVKESKFGIDIERAEEVYLAAASLQGIQIKGIHCHIGSMIMDVEPFVRAVRLMADLVRRLKTQGITLQKIDIGGGLGIDYKNIVNDGSPNQSSVEKGLLPKDLFHHIMPLLNGMNVKLIFEPGRYLVADTAALVTCVTLTKRTKENKFVVVDAGMNDLIRPSLYDSYHQIVAVNPDGRDAETVDVVGPICESGDFFAHNRPLSRVKRGDLLAIMGAGAYGYTLSSNYNGRLRPSEVLVEGDTYRLIRAREKIDVLWKGIL